MLIKNGMKVLLLALGVFAIAQNVAAQTLEQFDDSERTIECLMSGDCDEPFEPLISIRCTSRGLTPTCTKWCILFQAAMNTTLAECIQQGNPSYKCLEARSAERSYARIFANCLRRETTLTGR